MLRLCDQRFYSALRPFSPLFAHFWVPNVRRCRKGLSADDPLCLCSRSAWHRLVGSQQPMCGNARSSLGAVSRVCQAADSDRQGTREPAPSATIGCRTLPRCEPISGDGSEAGCHNRRARRVEQPGPRMGVHLWACASRSGRVFTPGVPTPKRSAPGSTPRPSLLRLRWSAAG